MSKTTKFIIALIIIILLALAAYFFVFLNKDEIDTTSYYAVFLTNGQVYFGNMKSQTEREFVLNNVYYLQLEKNDQTAQAQLAESLFSLIKMGNEIHGPTNEMFINRQSILFYEKLRDDSKVVDSILKSK